MADQPTLDFNGDKSASKMETNPNNTTSHSSARIQFLPVYGFDAFEPLCSLLKMDEFLIMLDCGWNSAFEHSEISNLDEIAAQGLIAKLDCVLISHGNMLHCGGLPYLYGKLGCTAPIISTVPCFQMSIYSIWDSYAAMLEKCNDFTLFNSNDIAHALSMFDQKLKFRELCKIVKKQQTPQALSTKNKKHKKKKKKKSSKLKQNGDSKISKTTVSKSMTVNLNRDSGTKQLNIVAFNAGHTIGGTIWSLRCDYLSDLSVVYAIDYNAHKEYHLNASDLQTDIINFNPNTENTFGLLAKHQGGAGGGGAGGRHYSSHSYSRSGLNSASHLRLLFRPTLLITDAMIDRNHDRFVANLKEIIYGNKNKINAANGGSGGGNNNNNNNNNNNPNGTKQSTADPHNEFMKLLKNDRFVQKFLGKHQKSRCLNTAITNTLFHAGNVLIPCDASTRSLELILIIYTFFAKNAQRLQHKYSLVICGYATHWVIQAARSMLEWMEESRQRELYDQNRNAFNLFSKQSRVSLTCIESLQEWTAFKAELQGNFIALATNEFVEGGLSQTILLEFLPLSDCLVLLTQRQVKKTVAGQLYKIYQRRMKKWYARKYGTLPHIDLMAEEEEDQQGISSSSSSRVGANRKAGGKNNDDENINANKDVIVINEVRRVKLDSNEKLEYLQTLKTKQNEIRKRIEAEKELKMKQEASKLISEANEDESNNNNNNNNNKNNGDKTNEKKSNGDSKENDRDGNNDNDDDNTKKSRLDIEYSNLNLNLHASHSAFDNYKLQSNYLMFTFFDPIYSETHSRSLYYGGSRSSGRNKNDIGVVGTGYGGVRGTGANAIMTGGNQMTPYGQDIDINFYKENGQNIQRLRRLKLKRKRRRMKQKKQMLLKQLQQKEDATKGGNTGLALQKLNPNQRRRVSGGSMGEISDSDVSISSEIDLNSDEFDSYGTVSSYSSNSDENDSDMGAEMSPALRKASQIHKDFGQLLKKLKQSRYSQNSAVIARERQSSMHGNFLNDNSNIERNTRLFSRSTHGAGLSAKMRAVMGTDASSDEDDEDDDDDDGMNGAMGGGNGTQGGTGRGGQHSSTMTYYEKTDLDGLNESELMNLDIEWLMRDNCNYVEIYQTIRNNGQEWSVECEVDFMNFEGRSNDQVIREMLRKIESKEIIFFHSSLMDKNDLARYCSMKEIAHNITVAHTQHKFEWISARMYENYYNIYMPYGCMAHSLKFNKIRNYNIAAIINGKIIKNDIKTKQIEYYENQEKEKVKGINGKVKREKIQEEETEENNLEQNENGGGGNENDAEDRKDGDGDDDDGRSKSNNREDILMIDVNTGDMLSNDMQTIQDPKTKFLKKAARLNGNMDSYYGADNDRIYSNLKYFDICFDTIEENNDDNDNYNCKDNSNGVNSNGVNKKENGNMEKKENSNVGSDIAAKNHTKVNNLVYLRTFERPSELALALKNTKIPTIDDASACGPHGEVRTSGATHTQMKMNAVLTKQYFKIRDQYLSHYQLM